MDKIGRSFGQDLKDAGLGHLTLGWNRHGLTNVEHLSPAEIAQVMLVLDAHDPTAPGPAPPLNDLETRIMDVIEILEKLGVPPQAQVVLQRMKDWLTDRQTPRIASM